MTLNRTDTDRRAILVGAGALAATVTGACRAIAGTPTLIPTFQDIARQLLPASVETVRTSGFARPGWGGAVYKVDPALDPAYCRRNPLSAIAAADGRVFRLWEPEVVRPSQFGAATIAGQDDTAMLRAFFRHAAKRLEGDPGATYTVRPGPPDEVILSVERGFVSDGRGATIRLAAGAGEWTALIGNLDVRTDLDGVQISGWTFEGNASASSPPLVEAGLLRYPRHLLCIRRGSGFRMRNCTVRDVVSTNVVLFSGDGATVDGIVEDCTFEAIGDGPGVAYHDHSTLYLTGDAVHVRRCIFRASWGAPGAVCAVELHPGRNYSVEDCRIEGFHTGINIAGIHETASVGGEVTGNAITTLRRGIAIYSGAYRDHTSGYGIDGLGIDDNTIAIRNDTPRGRMTGGGIGVIGIGVLAGATLGIRGVTLGARNSLTFDRETHPPDWQGIPVGVGVLEDSSDAVFEDIRVDAMAIANAPAVAVAMGFGRGVFRDVAVKARIVNCGTSRAAHVNDLHRTAIFASATAFEGTVLLEPEVADTGQRRQIVNTFVIGARRRSDARVTLAGSLRIVAEKTGYGFTIFPLDANVVPTVAFVQNFAYYGRPNLRAAPGSYVTDLRTATRARLPVAIER